MINSIELINWKTHGSTRLSFSKGTNILIGQMGAGKSSVMDAISFGLFGTFPAIKNRRVNVSDLIRNRPNQKKSAKIRISFDIGDDAYTVEREISSDDSAKATLQKNGAYVQSQPQRVTEEVEKALAMDYDLFSRAIYSEQNRLDYFLELRSSDRKKQIDNLLGLDKFANAQENTTSLINRIKEMMDESRKTAEGFDMEGQKKQLERLGEEKGKMAEEEKSILAVMEKLRLDSAKTEASLKEMKERYNKKIELAKETAELRSKAQVLEKEISRIDSEKLGEIEEIGRKLKLGESQLEALRRRSKEIMAQMQAAQARLGKMQGELAAVMEDMKERDRLIASAKGKGREKVAAELEERRKEMDKLESELASVAAQRSEADKWARELEKHISRCPVCERELEPGMKETLLSAKKALMKELGERAKGMQELQRKGRNTLEELNDLLNKLTVVEEKLKSYSGLDEKKGRMEKETEKAAEESARLKKEVETAGLELDRAGEEIARLRNGKEKLERRAAYLSERARNEESVGKKEKELGRIEVDDKKLDAVQKEFTAISSGISRNSALLDSNKKALREKSMQIEERKREMEKVERIYGDIRAKAAVIENLNKFNNSLKETQAQMRSRLVSSINRIMQQIWPELYPYGDYPNLELAATEGDYILRIATYREEKEVWEDVDAIASGGERSIACLAMRVAFALVLVPNLKWLILDEPTHNIDQLGIERFVRVFNEKLPEIVDQIFIITHDEQLKQVSNGKVYMLSRKKGENGETVAEEL
ncbi:MAG TPA: AAA family ATPase [Candidatus Saccharimonadales bacterium]|nr:AAA family ATPase [Candidatus Saccharimonadales bacterium]